MTERTLVLGIGNVLMGDEGIGVHVVNALSLPQEGSCEGEGRVTILDGGTGGFHLLGPMQEAQRIVLIDAAVDDSPIGTVRKLKPRFSTDYPRTLTAHDIGLKDLLDAYYLMDRSPDVTLFAVTIDPHQEMTLELSPAIESVMPRIAEMVRDEVMIGMNG